MCFLSCNDKQSFPFPPDDSGPLASSLSDLLCQSLSEDPSRRPSAEALLRHPFVTGKHGVEPLRGGASNQEGQDQQWRGGVHMRVRYPFLTERYVM